MNEEKNGMIDNSYNKVGEGYKIFVNSADHVQLKKVLMLLLVGKRDEADNFVSEYVKNLNISKDLKDIDVPGTKPLGANTLTKSPETDSHSTGIRR